MEIRTILYPTDFSEESTAALPLAESIARSNKASVIIAHVHEPGVIHGVGMAGAYATPAEEFEQSKKLLEQVELEDTSIPVRRQLLEGAPPTSLCELAESEEDIDLIVMSTHGRSGISRLIMGSVAEAIVRNAPCPVLSLSMTGKFAQQTG